MSRCTRAFLLAGAPLFLIGLTIIAMMVGEVYEDPEIDDLTKIGLPASATRVLYYDGSGIDTATWTAFSAGRSEIEACVHALTEKPLSELEDWKATALPPIDPPNRPDKFNKGNWDVDTVTKGKIFSSYRGRSGLKILVDTVRWRVFLYSYTT